MCMVASGLLHNSVCVYIRTKLLFYPTNFGVGVTTTDIAGHSQRCVREGEGRASETIRGLHSLLATAEGWCCAACVEQQSLCWSCAFQAACACAHLAQINRTFWQVNMRSAHPCPGPGYKHTTNSCTKLWFTCRLHYSLLVTDRSVHACTMSASVGQSVVMSLTRLFRYSLLLVNVDILLANVFRCGCCPRSRLATSTLRVEPNYSSRLGEDLFGLGTFQGTAGELYTPLGSYIIALAQAVPKPSKENAQRVVSIDASL